MTPATSKDNIVQIETEGEDPIKLNIYKGDVVISGIGGRFPESEDNEEFKRNLYDGVDMVTVDGKHWPAGTLGIPPRSGKLKNLDLFDASFFGITEKQADATDPQFRIILETAYEAIVDAGVNPQTLRGTNTGVFVGCAINESEICRTHDPSDFSKYSLLTYCRSLMANFISFAFDLRGPSYLVDAACASSYFAIHQALIAIRMGQCDAAIVAAGNIILRPNTTLALQRLGVLSPRGKSCSFDASADGYVRSEAVVAIFMQKSTDARRIYATLVNAKVNIDGSKVKGIVFPSREAQRKLIEDVYAAANVNLHDVAFVECHATGTKVGDTEEGNAVAAAFCKDRNSPLLISSTRTNIGHSEAVAGLSSLVKIIFSMETEFIPPCLNFENPSPRIDALNDGRMKVITEVTPMSSPYVSANSFGLGGTNGHILIKAHQKNKEPTESDSVPRLVCVSGRTEAAVEHMLEKIMSQPRDDEFYALIHKIHEFNIPQHDYRGFALLSDARPWKEIQLANMKPRPIWYVFSGIGSQWVGLARDLVKFEKFKELANKVAHILKTEDFDLMKIFTSTDESIMDNVLHSIVSITAIQVILVDFLKQLGMKPDGMIGHSLGEIGCAYADNTLTLEEAIMISYWRGKCLLDSKLPKRAMAAVGLSWEQVAKRAPAGIEIACHNYADVTTISGPCDLIEEFINHLNQDKIFGSRIPSAGFAFHSSYIADVSPIFLEKLEKIITNPKPRSNKWFSTSIPPEKWNSPEAHYSSPAYHLNNFLSPVLFYEALKMIPQNAIVVEIGPHALLQSILKKGLSSNGATLGLLDKYQPDNLEFLLKNIGRLYNEGVQPNVQNIFPPIQFPVSRGTPMIQPLIRWDHSVSYDVPYFTDPSCCYLNDNTILRINPSNDEHSFYLNHSIGGKVIFPASGYIVSRPIKKLLLLSAGHIANLSPQPANSKKMNFHFLIELGREDSYLIWQMFAKFHGKSVEDFPIIIEEIQFLQATIIQTDVKFSITILMESGSFEITESGSLVAKGYIQKPDNIQNQFLPLPKLGKVSNYQLNAAEIYSEFNLRGYNYKGEFCGIKSSDDCGSYGEIYATENVTAFIDAMLQFVIFGTLKKRDLELPSRIHRIVIDPHKYKELRQSLPENRAFLPINHYKNMKTVYCGGIEIIGMQTKLAPYRQQEKATPLIKKYSFVPYETGQEFLELDLLQVLTVIFNIVTENSISSNKPKIVIIHESGSISDSLVAKFSEIIKSRASEEVNFIAASSLPGFRKQGNKFGAQLITNNLSSGPVDTNCTLVAMTNATKNPTKFKNLVHSISRGGFILSVEDTLPKFSFENLGLKRIMKLNVNGKFILLFRKVNSTLPLRVISVKKASDQWIDEIQHTKEDVKTLILSQEQNRAIVELIKTTNKNNLRSLYILDTEIGDSFLESSVITEQLKNDLVQNVLKGSLWGSYQYLNVEKQSDLQLSAHVYVKSHVPGEISGLQWVKDPAAEESVEIGIGNVKHMGDSHFDATNVISLCSIEKRITLYRDEKIRTNYFQKLYNAKTITDNIADHGSNGTKVCHVYFTSLNTRDLSVVSGGGSTIDYTTLPNEPKDKLLGLEFAGRDEEGRRVMGIAEGCLSTTVRPNLNFLWEVPQKWSLEEASSIPLSYAEAYYGLYLRGNLQAGESILIHNGAQYVCQAAISIALHATCKVYVTVGNGTVESILQKQFANIITINYENVQDSLLEHEILKLTNDRGVSLIFNSKTTDKLSVIARCLQKNGRFVQMSKLVDGNLQAKKFPVEILKNGSLHVINFDVFMNTDAENSHKLSVTELMKDGIENGAIIPLHRKIYSEDNLDIAFKSLSDDNQTLKATIKIRDEEPQSVIKPSPRFLHSNTSVRLHHTKTYVLIGNFDRTAVELVYWLISKGATNIAFATHEKIENGYQSFHVQQWIENHVNLLFYDYDCTNESGTNNLLQKANTLGPLGAIFYLEHISQNNRPNVLSKNLPTVTAIENLDTVSRTSCLSLDYFVVFSSNTATHNENDTIRFDFIHAVAERICENRQAEGFPSVAIQWEALETIPLTMLVSYLSCLDQLLQNSDPIVIVSTANESDTTNETTETKTEMLNILKNTFGIKTNDNLLNCTLPEVGLDSLMSVELQKVFQRKFGKIITANDIQEITIGRLIELHAEKQ